MAAWNEDLPAMPSNRGKPYIPRQTNLISDEMCCTVTAKLPLQYCVYDEPVRGI